MEEEGDLDVVFQVLADMRRIDLTRDARSLELAISGSFASSALALGLGVT